MTTLAFSLLALLPTLPAHPQSNAQSSNSQNPPVLGSHETPSRHIESSGFTLDKLHGMPMVRPVWVPPQPQVRVYPQYMAYPRYSYQYQYPYGLGGYRPPGTGSYSSQALFFVR